MAEGLVLCHAVKGEARMTKYDWMLDDLHDMIREYGVYRIVQGLLAHYASELEYTLSDLKAQRVKARLASVCD